MMPVRHRTSFPPSPLSDNLCRAFLKRLASDTDALQSAASDWPNGKSYPVTAAQLLPSLTGFLAPIHFSKLAKNRDED